MSGTTPEAATSGTTPASETADLVSLGDEQRAIEILAQSILGRWEVVNNLPRLRPQRRHEEWISESGSRE